MNTLYIKRKKLTLLTWKVLNLLSLYPPFNYSASLELKNVSLKPIDIDFLGQETLVILSKIC